MGQDLSPEQENKMNWIFLSLLLVCAAALELEDIAKISRGSKGSEGVGLNARKPKFFLVSTTSVTTTIKANTNCYVTQIGGNPAPTITTCKRKKRAISLSDDDFLTEFESSEVEGLESGIENDDTTEERQGRFFLYWLTTTVYTTATSSTSTFTIQSVLCTPSGASTC